MKTKGKLWLSIVVWHDVWTMIIQDRDYIAFCNEKVKVTGNTDVEVMVETYSGKVLYNQVPDVFNDMNSAQKRKHMEKNKEKDRGKKDILVIYSSDSSSSGFQSSDKDNGRVQTEFCFHLSSCLASSNIKWLQHKM